MCVCVGVGCSLAEGIQNQMEMLFEMTSILLLDFVFVFVFAIILLFVFKEISLI